MSKTYEKPGIKFVSFDNESAIAAGGNCWSQDVNGTNADHKWIYDTDQGYAWFISNGESCGNGNIVEYIQYGHEDGKDQNGNVIDAYPIEEEMKELINEAAADPSNHGLKALVSTDGFYIS